MASGSLPLLLPWVRRLLCNAALSLWCSAVSSPLSWPCVCRSTEMLFFCLLLCCAICTSLCVSNVLFRGNASICLYLLLVVNAFALVTPSPFLGLGSFSFVQVVKPPWLNSFHAVLVTDSCLFIDIVPFSGLGPCILFDLGKVLEHLLTCDT